MKSHPIIGGNKGLYREEPVKNSYISILWNIFHRRSKLLENRYNECTCMSHDYWQTNQKQHILSWCCFERLSNCSSMIQYQTSYTMPTGKILSINTLCVHNIMIGAHYKQLILDLLKQHKLLYSLVVVATLLPPPPNSEFPLQLCHCILKHFLTCFTADMTQTPDYSINEWHNDGQNRRHESQDNQSITRVNPILVTHIWGREK